MKKISALLTTLLVSITNYAHAIPFKFEDDIFYANDVVFAHFTLTEARDVSLWTDSCKNLVNFDPNITLWKADGTKIGHNDDDASVGPNQTFGDAGLVIPALAAGDYIVTLAMFNNWALGDKLTDGFEFDYYAKTTLSDWHLEFGTSGGPSWSLWLSDVDDAHVSSPSNSVPEPAPLALLLAGLMALGVKRKRRHA